MANSKSTAAKSKTNKGNVVTNQSFFPFDKRNYYLMVAGLVLVVLGFLCMTGAKVTDPNVFDRSEIYSFRRITLAPILIIGGFVVEVFAIMLKPKAKAE